MKTLKKVIQQNINGFIMDVIITFILQPKRDERGKLSTFYPDDEDTIKHEYILDNIAIYHLEDLQNRLIINSSVYLEINKVISETLNTVVYCPLDY